MLNVKNVFFQYHSAPVLRDINFTLKKGELISLVGESGSGKSTLLKAIYGLLDLSEGSISWHQKQILGPLYQLVPGEDTIKYVSQHFELMPYITAAENIGKYLSNFYPKEKSRRTAELLNLIGMKAFAKTKARFLSGGQQQRIALAQALAKAPELLLLDEPFSQIDSFKKNELRRTLFSYLKKKNISCIVATHDATDALSFADRTMVLKDGEIIDLNTPEHVYNNPKDYYTATLFGEVNNLPVSFFYEGGERDKQLLLYPHELQVNPLRKGLKVRVRASFFKGSNYLIEGIVRGRDILFEHPEALEVNSRVFLTTVKHFVSRIR